MHGPGPVTRRDFLASAPVLGLALRPGAARLFGQAPAIVTSDRLRPLLPSGIQSGDPNGDRAIVWGRADRPARMIVEWATNEAFRDSRRVSGPPAGAGSDFTARVDLTGLPLGSQVFYRVRFESLASPRASSEPLTGRFRTPPARRRDLLLAWSGDTVGQGWGINPDWGGLRIFETMATLEPDAFIHSGDQVYADGPLAETVMLDDGRLWKNVVTPAKSKVAETLAEFRGNFEYNLMDAHARRFNAQVPLIVQWDDHETLNNWFPGQQVEDERYTERRASVLSARARQAMFEFTPIRRHPRESDRIYRAINYGPALEVFVLDQRSYRGPNTHNRHERRGTATTMLGAAQAAWLKTRLQASSATWKLIASDMPIGLIVPDRSRNGVVTYEAWANGNGPPLGRELEVADLLSFLNRERIRNLVWITADVHYAAAHYYSPERARFRNFHPFWEFVAGPMHAGTFGPNALDDTFGPEVKFTAIPAGMKPNRPPSDGLQFFGTIRLDGRTDVMTVALHDLSGRRLYSVDLEPEPRRG